MNSRRFMSPLVACCGGKPLRSIVVILSRQTGSRVPIGELYYLAPLPGFIGDELAEIGGRAAKRHAIQVGEPPLWRGAGENRARPPPAIPEIRLRWHPPFRQGEGRTHQPN